jgi:hypothetical protein
MRNRGGDRRGSNPRPSEPQSADICCGRLHVVAETAYFSRIARIATTSYTGPNILGGVPVVYMVYRPNCPGAPGRHRPIALQRPYLAGHQQTMGDPIRCPFTDRRDDGRAQDAAAWRARDGHGLLGESANSQAKGGVRDELVEYGLPSDEAASVRRPAGGSRNRSGDALGPTRA